MMRLSRSLFVPQSVRVARNAFSTTQIETARSALEKSCYKTIDYKISEQATVFEAVQRMAANNIGCMAVTEGDGSNGRVVGVISERDYLSKVALLGKASKDTKCSEICTHGKANIVVVDIDDSIDDCCRKILGRDIRHLIVVDKLGGVVGMISIKDVVKVLLSTQTKVLKQLTTHALGAGAFYSDK
eukprot:gene955-1855_t